VHQLNMDPNMFATILRTSTQGNAAHEGYVLVDST